MGNKVSVTVTQGVGRPRQLSIDPDATEGATLGTNLVLGSAVTLSSGVILPAGYVLSIADVVNGATASPTPTAGGAVAWQEVAQKPIPAKQLEGLTGTGMVAMTPQGWTMREIVQGNGINVTNGRGQEGNPTVSLRQVELSTAGTLFAIAVDEFGRIVSLKPVVQGGGITIDNQAGQVVISSATLPAWASAVVAIPATTEVHRETIAAAGVTPASRIEVMLAPVVDSDENAPEMLDMVVLQASPGSGQFDVLMTFTQPQRGPIKILYRST